MAVALRGGPVALRGGVFGPVALRNGGGPAWRRPCATEATLRNGPGALRNGAGVAKTQTIRKNGFGPVHTAQYIRGLAGHARLPKPRAFSPRELPTRFRQRLEMI